MVMKYVMGIGSDVVVVTFRCVPTWLSNVLDNGRDSAKLA